MRTFHFIFCFFLFVNRVFSQNLITQDSVDTDKHYFPIAVGVSFNSNNFHSGVRLSVEKIHAINRHDKYRADSVYKTKYGVKFVSYNFLYNRDKDFNTSYSLGADYGMRRVKKKGRMKELVVGVGITKTFLTKAAFTVENNQVKQKFLPGNLYGNANIMAGFGKDCSFTKSIPLKWHIRAGANILFPYGSFIMPYFAMDMGVVYRIKAKPFAVKHTIKDNLN